MKEIQGLCRTYLWTGKDQPSTKALVSWSRFFFLRLEVAWTSQIWKIWNKATIAKHLWAIALKQDKLWIQWIHSYYIRRANIWTMKVHAGMSWVLEKIMNCKNFFENGIKPHEYEKDGMFSINKCYTAQISWKRLICNNKTSPKSLFITWLVVLNRLATKFKLAHWNMVNDTTWGLCNNAEEDVNHLFFNCVYSTTIWGISWVFLESQEGHNPSWKRSI